jgi:integrase
MKENKPLQPHFSSVFAPYEHEYVGIHRALGKKFHTRIACANQFDKYCVEHDTPSTVLSEDLFNGFCKLRPNEAPMNRYHRVNFMREFAHFLNERGVETPTRFYPMRLPKSDFMPYIFSMEEIARFFEAADRIEPSKNSSIWHLIIPVLFRMLYCCGLRLGEALRLKNEDVDLEIGMLLIKNAKGNKDRFVPMSESLTQLCREYKTDSRVRNFGGEYFFPATDRGFYANSSMHRHFQELLWQANISYGGRGKGPRIHDFRHTFAVHTLSKWARGGKDLYVCLPILSTYLGHCNLSGTQQYLRLVPENYDNVTAPFETRFGTVFPEVSDDEE